MTLPFKKDHPAGETLFTATINRRRIMAIWLPYLSTDRILRQRHGPLWRTSGIGGKQADSSQGHVPPLVLSRKEQSAYRIAAMNEAAEVLGLRPGMGIADARAMHPDLEILEEDPAADTKMLSFVADWCDHFTPLVALDGNDGLALDISGCAHLFGGEDAMLADVKRRLALQGFDAWAGLASTRGMAWAAARFSNTKVEPGLEGEALAPMPLAALRIEPEVRRKLESVGLYKVGALLNAPRAPLARRFGRVLVNRLDQALGLIDDAISPRLPVPPLSVERRLNEPIALLEDIEHLLLLLARTLKQDLERRGEGARHLLLSLFRVDGVVRRIAVRTSRPTREPKAVVALFREKFTVLENSLDPGHGFDLIRLGAASTAPWHDLQDDMTGHASQSDKETFALVMDRLRARLGDHAVLAPFPAASHSPERQAQFMPFEHLVEVATSVSQSQNAALAGLGRPLRLLARPELIEAAAEVPEGPPFSFRWRKALYRVTRAEGPERIAPEWWLETAPSVVRDYFRIEDTEGRRFWLFREGMYDDETTPRWFIHGLFP